MPSLLTIIDEYIKRELLPSSYRDVALEWFIPLCNSIVTHQNESVAQQATKARPLFIGVNGCQGSGKSTLSGLLQFVLTQHFKKSTVVCSLDDFYLSKSDRLTLSQTVHPLLATRGVPGTHDVSLMSQVLSALEAGQSVRIPKFDKSIDDRAGESEWQEITDSIDIIIIEGWCWGTRSQSSDQITNAVNSLERERDPKGIWRRYVNTALKESYEPLYSHIDKWVFLRAPSFDAVYTWRLQQERKLRSRVGNAKHIMSDEEILSFIQYYQRLTVHTLCTLEQEADWIFELDNERNITKSRQHAKSIDY